MTESPEARARARLAEVREAILAARAMPMSASVVVNRAELLEALDGLEATLVSAFQESTHVVASRDGVVDEGREAAEAILREAEHERERIVAETEVVRAAERKAKRILEDAQRAADALRAEADEYADGTLASFEITLERTAEAVRKGRQSLAGTTSMSALTPEEADKLVLPEHWDD